jgi:heavy metal sensor kinase
MKFNLSKYVKTTRFKTTLWYTAVFLLLEFVMGFLLYFFLKQALYKELDVSLIKQAETIYHLVAESKIDLSDFKPDSVYSSTDELVYDLIFEAVTLNPNNTFVQVNLNGKTIFSTANLLNKKLNIPDTENEGEKLYSFYDSDLSNHPIRSVNFKKGKYRIIVAFPVLLINQMLDRLINLYILIAPLFLFLLVLGGALISYRSLSRIDKIIKKTDEITTRNLSEIVEGEEFDDEYGRLVKTMNNMIHRIRTSVEYMDHFSSSASHELKTPLTVLRGEIELALKSDKTPEEYREILRSNQEETLKLINIISRLFYLSRIDNSVIQINKQKVSLEPLIDESLKQFHSLIVDKEMKVTFKGNETDEYLIDADPDLLKQVFINLVENAVKYGLPASEIRIRIVPGQNRKTEINISNFCEYIPPESLSKLFDRFYRLETSRNSNLGGVGLGLSVVKSIINLHEGEISVDYSDENKITFTVLI